MQKRAFLETLIYLRKHRAQCMRILLTILFLCHLATLKASSSDTLHLSSPGRQLNAHIFLTGNRLMYTVSTRATTIILPSATGLTINAKELGSNVRSFHLQKQSSVTERFSTRLNQSEAASVSITYQLLIRDDAGTYEMDFRLFDEGCAFRYRLRQSQGILTSEHTQFALPATSAVWYFERNSDWKLKSYAGLWQQAPVEKLPTVSSQGPVQGKPLVAEVPSGGYAVITEAALYNYSGMRLKAIGSNTVQVNFTEGAKGFAIPDDLVSPWRVILYNNDLNALVNNTVIESLNPAPDSVLYAETDYIRAGKSVWSWITRKANYLQPEEERSLIDAAASLRFEFTMIDEGWEINWKDKWSELKALADYAAGKHMGVWVWKHSRDLRDTAYRNRFLDSLQRAGAVGIKTDFMNSEAKDLIDFETGLLKAAARRRLMVNFHGCHAPTGESRTYPNEMTREGVRGMELNIMNEPIPAWHNAALPFTRFLCGHGDYTPGFFTNRAKTTLAHQLALFYLFNSPFQCMSEDPRVLFSNDTLAPLIPFLQTLPATWDQTVVLPGSSIGKVAAFARRKGKDWYVAVINGGEAPVRFDMDHSFLKRRKNYRVTALLDTENGLLQSPVSRAKKGRRSTYTLLPAGGLVLKLKS